MCGIAGIISVNKISMEALHSMTDVIAHRGPDGQGHWINNQAKVGFGHRRLSIIDLSENGKQPMHYMNGRYTITFNGEIYNYIELKEQLLKKGYHFTSNSDTEVLMALYDHKKENCLDELDGMFAFAIWDEVEQNLFCARDRFGEKPFYYYKDKDRFVFASEIKQFWTIGIEKKLDPEKISRFIQFSEVLEDQFLEKTFYENIYSLKAAHYLTCNNTIVIKTTNYWNLNAIQINTAISFKNAKEKLVDLFNHSIKNRLRADVPLGSSLSGGLDSSCIVYTVNQLFLKPSQTQYTFSARFKNYEKDEGEYIDALLKEMPNIKRTDVFLDADQFEQNIQSIIYHQDEPFQSASIFAQYKVMELARRNNVTVLLDGQGADELLGGYESLYVDYLKQLFYNNTNLYKTEVKSYNNIHALKYGETDFYKNDTLKLKFNRQLKKMMHKEQAVPQNHFFNVLKNYITGSQLQQLLRYADRNSMAHSIETRLPFLNRELVEFVFSLPDDYKLNNGWPKFILREAFENKVPDKIIWRKNKVGFETPESVFLQTEKSLSKIQMAKQYILDNRICNTENINPWLLYMVNSYTNS